jgi:hypothetical protein
MVKSIVKDSVTSVREYYAKQAETAPVAAETDTEQ